MSESPALSLTEDDPLHSHPGEENILDDLLQQSNEHENMFEDDEKKEEDRRDDDDDDDEEEEIEEGEASKGRDDESGDSGRTKSSEYTSSNHPTKRGEGEHKRQEEDQRRLDEAGEDISDEELAHDGDDDDQRHEEGESDQGIERTKAKKKSAHSLEDLEPSDVHSDISDSDMDDEAPRDMLPTGSTTKSDQDLTSGRGQSPSKPSTFNDQDDQKVDEKSPGKKPGSQEGAQLVAKREATPPRKRSWEKIEPPASSDPEPEESIDERENVEEKKKKSDSGKKSGTGKSYDYATKLNYLFRDARVFLVKSNNAENVALSKAKNVWSTPPANESRFNQAFQESRNVLLVFSVKESGRFAGFARMASGSRRDGPSVSWVLPPGLSAKALGGVFELDWVCRKELSFQRCQHLTNPWNEGKPVKIGRDGQEIQPNVALELCRLFPEDQTIDMTPILRKSKESARQQRAKSIDERSRAIPKTRPLSSNRGPPSRPIHSNRYDDQGPLPPRMMSRKRSRMDDRDLDLPPMKMARARSSPYRSSSSPYSRDYPPSHQYQHYTPSSASRYPRNGSTNNRQDRDRGRGGASSRERTTSSSVLHGAHGPRLSSYMTASGHSAPIQRSYYSSLGTRSDRDPLPPRRESRRYDFDDYPSEHGHRGSRMAESRGSYADSGKTTRRVYARR